MLCSKSHWFQRGLNLSKWVRGTVALKCNLIRTCSDKIPTEFLGYILNLKLVQYE